MPKETQNSVETLKVELQGQKDIFVLYLDDEKDLLESISDVVSQLGLKPLVTTDPAQALQWVVDRRGDLAMIISDLKMPGMDGFEFRKAVLDAAPEVPFAILSAHVDMEIALRGLELKICAFIDKPINESKCIERACREVVSRVRVIKEDREFRGGFVSEAEVLLRDAEALLLSIDQSPQDAENISRFFGIIHTLKGASGFFEPKTFHRVAHRYEDLLKKLQGSEIEYSESFSDVLFLGFDLLKELLVEIKTGIHQKRDLDSTLAQLDFNVAEQGGAAVPNKVDSPDAPKRAAVTAQKGAARSNEDVRVSVALLNEFMQLSGEVTVIRNMLNKCVRAVERQYSGDRDIAMVAELLSELHKINGGMQGKISEIRKVPVKAVIQALPRAVRDVSKQIGKKVELEIIGDDLRVDTAIAEVLSNSLLHIVKNSMDHGLENPEKRILAGKGESGKISLRFAIKDEKVVVEIEDDGQGLNVEAIKSKLIKNGSHTAEQAESLQASELYGMIFTSGFSTAAQVTDISGRGVGMSMVKDSVDAMGGEIQIESKPGLGAKFSLILPVPKSVLIVSCLSVRSGGLQLGLVQDDILRVMQIEDKQAEELIRDASGARTLIFDGELVPLVRLRDLMGISPEGAQTDLTGIRRIIVMHSTQDQRRVALEVDEVLDVEDTVIKGIHASLNSMAIFRGVTFLDDGLLGLIISTAGIMDSLKLTRAARAKTLEKVEVLPVHTAIQIELSVPGTYALRLEDIHRIEEVQQSLFRRSGGATVISYRGGILEVRELSHLMSNSPGIRAIEKDSEIFTMIVVRRGERLLGLKVAGVLDTLSFSEFQNELADPLRAIEGHFISEGKTITLLSIARVIALLEGDQPLREAIAEGSEEMDLAS